MYSNRLRIVVQRLLEKDQTRRLSAVELLSLIPKEEFGLEDPITAVTSTSIIHQNTAMQLLAAMEQPIPIIPVKV
jgi:hypothetical protein